MQYLVAAVLAGAMALFAAHAAAADEKLTIAVFTKNSTNPAYEAFRIGPGMERSSPVRDHI